MGGAMKIIMERKQLLSTRLTKVFDDPPNLRCFIIGFNPREEPAVNPSSYSDHSCTMELILAFVARGGLRCGSLFCLYFAEKASLTTF